MGIKVDMAALSNQASSAQSVMAARAAGYSSLIAALNTFISAVDLQGAAHSAEKTYASNYLIPLINGAQVLSEDGAQDLVEIANKYASEVGESLDEDELVAMIEAAQSSRLSQIAILGALSLATPAVGSSLLSQVKDNILSLQTEENALQEKLTKLRDFNASVASIFEGVTDLQRAVDTGLGQLANSFDVTKGSYTVPTNLSWVGEIDIYKHSKWKYVEQRIENVKNSDLSETEKANQIVKAYEDHLYATNRRAFDEYWGVRKKYKATEWKADVLQDIYKDTEKNLGKELQKSGIDIKQFVNQMGKDILEVNREPEEVTKNRNYWTVGDQKLAQQSAAVGQGIGDTVNFIDLVNTGQPLDLKTRNYNDTYKFSVWGRQWEKGMSSDYLGNYLFGYIGVGYLSMSDQSLKVGAGIAQVASDKDVVKYLKNVWNGNYGDNAGDAKSIQDGINAYKESVK